jgi:hypothetical protein
MTVMVVYGCVRVVKSSGGLVIARLRQAFGEVVV